MLKRLKEYLAKVRREDLLKRFFTHLCSCFRFSIIQSCAVRLITKEVGRQMETIKTDYLCPRILEFVYTFAVCIKGAILLIYTDYIP